MLLKFDSRYKNTFLEGSLCENLCVKALPEPWLFMFFKSHLCICECDVCTCTWLHACVKMHAEARSQHHVFSVTVHLSFWDRDFHCI